MKITPTITFRGIDRSPALEEEIRARLDKLETYYPRIMNGRVLVELGQRRHETGNRFHVRIDLTVPGEEILVAHEANERATIRHVEADKIPRLAEPDPERKHAVVAVHEAFDIARRRLQDYARRQRGAVKTATKPAHGHVSRLSPTDEFGYIEAEDGHDVYFQKSSVLKDAFDQLTIGSAVSFVEESGEKGPQASTVRLRHPRRIHRSPRTSPGGRVVR